MNKTAKTLRNSSQGVHQGLRLCGAASGQSMKTTVLAIAKVILPKCNCVEL